MSTYRHNYAAFGKLVLNSPEMVAVMAEKAEKIKAIAVATAPDAPVVGVGFKYSFEVSSGTHGGIHEDRAYGRVTNTDPAARYIEFGTKDTPAHRTLGRALGAAGG